MCKFRSLKGIRIFGFPNLNELLHLSRPRNFYTVPLLPAFCHNSYPLFARNLRVYKINARTSQVRPIRDMTETHVSPGLSEPHIYTGEEGKVVLRILKSLISNDEATPEQAVQQIVDIVLAPEKYRGQLGDTCYYTAQGLLDVAAHTAPDKQHKLVTFLHKLRNKIVTNPSTGHIIKHEDRVLFTGLPSFGYTFADALHSIPVPNPTSHQIEAWENTMAFFAQLDASYQDDDDMDFTHTWVPMYLKAALEDVKNPGSYEVDVRLACIWLVYDAEKLWSNVPDKKGYTLTNWQLWKRNLQNTRSKYEDRGTRNMIDRAISEIERVEKI
ncbi:hypothetical protein GQ44DRAFT_718617 [Phaeosphaeriaceae sp. PMI808]|nr:hypothetical protein GQ44DRAFT_718617 [Phaeosphaeriaceae sp. PMI808]